jgi:hypothetical protein
MHDLQAKAISRSAICPILLTFKKYITYINLALLIIILLIIDQFFIIEINDKK